MELLIVAREMKHGIADDNISANASGNGIRSIAPNWKLLSGSPGPRDFEQIADVLNAVGISIQCEDVASLAQQMHEIAAVAASGIEHAHTRRNISAQNLIEDVDIDLAELFLDIHRYVLRA